jgi:hypothetical protein
MFCIYLRKVSIKSLRESPLKRQQTPSIAERFSPLIFCFFTLELI